LEITAWAKPSVLPSSEVTQQNTIEKLMVNLKTSYNSSEAEYA